MQEKLLLQAEHQLKKDQIVEMASKVVKESEEDIRGMTNVPTLYLSQLDTLLFELDQIDHKLR